MSARRAPLSAFDDNSDTTTGDDSTSAPGADCPAVIGTLSIETSLSPLAHHSFVYISITRRSRNADLSLNLVDNVSQVHARDKTRLD